MRIRLIIKDDEYCRAMLRTISQLDKDVYVEVGDYGGAENIDDRTVIVTDLNTKDHSFSHNRVVYLTANPSDNIRPNKPEEEQKIFKYKSISSIFSDIEQLSYLWTGITDSIDSVSSRIYAVCSDLADDSSRLSQALARQITFRHGGDILLLSLRYVNEYSLQDEKNNSKFARLMYYMDIGRTIPIDAFTYMDSYGISYLRLSTGLNPMAYMKEDDLIATVRNLSHMKFDTLILDIGDTYNEANIRMINSADNIIWFTSGRDRFDINDICVEKNVQEKVKRIAIYGKESDIELSIDDYVRNVYGIKEPENGNKQDNH